MLFFFAVTSQDGAAYVMDFRDLDANQFLQHGYFTFVFDGIYWSNSVHFVRTKIFIEPVTDPCCMCCMFWFDGKASITALDIHVSMIENISIRIFPR